jgi:drug/metabolite transporter (DMT)-like permease
MLAFAGNSLLCRVALTQTDIDPGSFTLIRVFSGSLVLCLLVQIRGRPASVAGDWSSALALFVYAAAFSFAYIELPAAVGALLLFVAVQVTMVGYGLWRGERLFRRQTAGLCLALAGLFVLLLPGSSAPRFSSALLMLSAGCAWGIYTLRGKSSGNPLAVNAGNFLRALVLASILSLATFNNLSVGFSGAAYAVASGALTSGLGYALWYLVVPALNAVSASSVQLSVPVLTAFGGVIFLGEAISLHLALSSLTILGGIALVTLPRSSSVGDQETISESTR